MSDSKELHQAATLIERLQALDPAAEQELARRFHGPVFAVALAKTGDYEAAEDIAQESLLRGLEALREGRLERPENVGAFLCGIARNLANNVLRSRRAHPETILDDGALVSADERPDQRCSRHELGALIGNVLAKIDPVDRKILLWTLVDELTAGEVAERLDLKAAAVRQRKHRALRRARVLLDSMSQKGTGRY